RQAQPPPAVADLRRPLPWPRFVPPASASPVSQRTTCAHCPGATAPLPSPTDLSPLLPSPTPTGFCGKQRTELSVLFICLKTAPSRPVNPSPLWIQGISLPVQSDNPNQTR